MAILDALKDDLNTPAAIAELHHLEARARSNDMPADAAAELVGSLLLLGFDRAVDHVKADDGLRNELVKSFRDESARELGLDPAHIDALVTERTLARKQRKFAESDRIRDELKTMGIELEDHKDGTTTWKVKR